MSDLTFWAQQRANWERPGALVRDPETGKEYRYISPIMLSDGNWLYFLPQGENDLGKIPRAIAAGPVVDDPATRGILTDWLRRASGDPTACVWFDDAHHGFDNGWTWRFKETSRCQCDSEIDALLEALHWALTSPDSPVREV